MTEAEWLACVDPLPMVELLHEGRSSRRKLRLFSCACCRRVWHLLTSDTSRVVIEIVERYLEGQATDEERRAAWKTVERVVLSTGQMKSGTALDLGRNNADLAAWLAGSLDRWDDAAAYTSQAAARTAGFAAFGDACFRTEKERDVMYINVKYREGAAVESAGQSDLLRCLFGNRFRPATLDPTWGTATVLDLARGIYEERAFDRLPILADALQEAGCENEEMLAHCRGPGPHARGCWVVDLVLGKE